MTLKTKIWIGGAAFFGPIFIGLATPDSAPAWILHVENIIVLAECVPLGLFILLLLTALFTPARVLDRIAERLGAWLVRDETPVREVPASDGIQVLGNFLRDDMHTFYERKYDIVRRIHGGDIASRLTREQIEAEYDRYDRAETAAGEDRCQHCDPDRVPADLLVEAWDEQPGHERHLGEWLLCVSHAEKKISSLRSTGAQVVSEPMTPAHVDEFTADHYGQGGVR